jgi:group I intron endonuclease
MLIYLIVGPTGKYYVGQTTRTLGRRWAQHVRDAHRNGRKQCRHLCAAIRKYGVEAFKVFPLMSTLTTKTQMDEQEIFLIALFRANDRKHGYNLTAGGGGALGLKPSLETRAKMRAKFMLPEAKAKLRVAMLGNKRSVGNKGRRGMKGTHEFSSEHKSKISASKMGHSTSPDTRVKLREASRRWWALQRNVQCAKGRKMIAGATGAIRHIRQDT